MHYQIHWYGATEINQKPPLEIIKHYLLPINNNFLLFIVNKRRIKNNNYVHKKYHVDHCVKNKPLKAEMIYETDLKGHYSCTVNKSN
jgi:hypothetical protein